MGLVTLATWKAYAKKADGDATLEALYQTFVDSAEQIVKDYLGYNPASQTYTSETYYGSGTSSLTLKSKPITAIASITVNGVSKTVGDYTIDGERITNKYGEIFGRSDIIVITYTAGLSAGDTRLGLVILTCMDIASLLSQNAGDNIGVSSVTMDGGNSRTFVNYNDFRKQLARLASLRLARLP